jgi:hypothetical protein
MYFLRLRDGEITLRLANRSLRNSLLISALSASVELLPSHFDGVNLNYLPYVYTDGTRVSPVKMDSNEAGECQIIYDYSHCDNEI